MKFGKASGTEEVLTHGTEEAGNHPFDAHPISYFPAYGRI